MDAVPDRLVDYLAKQEPKVLQEPQAYKRAVIRMTLQHIHERSKALDEMLRADEEEGLL